MGGRGGQKSPKNHPHGLRIPPNTVRGFELKTAQFCVPRFRREKILSCTANAYCKNFLKRTTYTTTLNNGLNLEKVCGRN